MLAFCPPGPEQVVCNLSQLCRCNVNQINLDLLIDLTDTAKRDSNAVLVLTHQRRGPRGVRQEMRGVCIMQMNHPLEVRKHRNKCRHRYSPLQRAGPPQLPHFRPFFFFVLGKKRQAEQQCRNKRELHGNLQLMGPPNRSLPGKLS